MLFARGFGEIAHVGGERPEWQEYVRIFCKVIVVFCCVFDESRAIRSIKNVFSYAVLVNGDDLGQHADRAKGSKATKLCFIVRVWS